MLSVKGVYQDGTITQLEPIPFLNKKEVVVTFIKKLKRNKAIAKSIKGILAGKLKFDEDDFIEAKKIWDLE
jgi:hypothetical protein